VEVEVHFNGQVNSTYYSVVPKYAPYNNLSTFKSLEDAMNFIKDDPTLTVTKTDHVKDMRYEYNK